MPGLKISIAALLPLLLADLLFAILLTCMAATCTAVGVLQISVSDARALWCATLRLNESTNRSGCSIKPNLLLTRSRCI